MLQPAKKCSSAVLFQRVVRWQWSCSSKGKESCFPACFYCRRLKGTPLAVVIMREVHMFPRMWTWGDLGCVKVEETWKLSQTLGKYWGSWKNGKKGKSTQGFQQIPLFNHKHSWKKKSQLKYVLLKSDFISDATGIQSNSSYYPKQVSLRSSLFPWKVNFALPGTKPVIVPDSFLLPRPHPQSLCTRVRTHAHMGTCAHTQSYTHSPQTQTGCIPMASLHFTSYCLWPVGPFCYHSNSHPQHWSLTRSESLTGQVKGLESTTGPTGKFPTKDRMRHSAFACTGPRENYQRRWLVKVSREPGGKSLQLNIVTGGTIMQSLREEGDRRKLSQKEFLEPGAWEECLCLWCQCGRRCKGHNMRWQLLREFM